jgi:hypothetical protein
MSPAGILFLAGALVALHGAPLQAQEIIDRIAARVENDVILLSDIRGLARYQQLVDGRSESDTQILDRLIDQWIVRSEAEAAQFPHPQDPEVNSAVEQLRKSYASPQEYEARKKLAGLTDADIRKMLVAQLYLNNYLDSRFRPAVQIDSKALEEFYQKSIVQRAQARGQAAPSLDASKDYIQEALVQRGINEQADRWLKESRARLKVEKFLDEAANDR